MGDSHDGGAVAGADIRIIDAAGAMLPKLTVILAAMIATCVAIIAISAGLIGARDADKHLADVPTVSRALMQRAIVEEPEWQHFELLAYSRRADELMRLRNLPVAPARAVVEYAERKSAEGTRAPAAPPAETIVASAPATPPPRPVAVAVPPTAEAAPAANASISAASAAAEAAPVVIASAPPAAPVVEPPQAPSAPATAIAPVPAVPSVPATVAVAAPSTAPASTPAPLAVPGEPPPAATIDPAAPIANIQLANVQSGSGATAAVKPAEKRAEAVEGKTHHHKKTVRVHKEPHKKPTRVARTRLAPTARTGFPVELPKASAQTGSASSAGSLDKRQDSY